MFRYDSIFFMAYRFLVTIPFFNGQIAKSLKLDSQNGKEISLEKNTKLGYHCRVPKKVKLFADTFPSLFSNSYCFLRIRVV